MDERCGHSGIHSAGQARHDAPFIAELSANTCDLILDNRFRRPITATAANRKQKVSQHLRAERRVCNLRMELNTIDAARLIFHRVQCVISKCCYMKARWHFCDMIAMTHPYVELLRQILKKTTRHVEHFQSCVAKLAIWRRGHVAAKLARKNLEPVTDTERWTVDRFEQLRMRFGRVVVINGRRSAGKDQTARRFRVNSIDGRVERKNLAVNTRFSDAPRDELCVLRSEVKYYYGSVSYTHLTLPTSDLV